MQRSTHETGKRGEDAAARYLVAAGYRIRGRNIRLGKYEIDIVASDPTDGTLVFAEVKTRSRQSDAYPIRTAVDARKRRAMRRAIIAYVETEQFEGPGRIDLLSVEGERVVEHMRDLGSDFV